MNKAPKSRRRFPRKWWNPPKYFKTVVVLSLLALMALLIWQALTATGVKEFAPGEIIMFGYNTPPEPTLLDKALAFMEAAAPWVPVVTPVVYFYFGKREGD